ncbi:hypothetical protein WB66_19545 [bacteria symbiont BFo1 of Frankliniella occidentalis]|nr:hypothetical protein WB66_19545 [bacteria symbiont BFo1 of Frankliniella occidentalis]KYP87967.1 hypothetical protein WB91_19585 [bacteria symbiont BFo1 of Frankliniella occidentalis]
MKRIIFFFLVFLVSFAIVSTLLFEIAFKYIDIEKLYNVVELIKPFKNIPSFDFFVLVTLFISMITSLITAVLLMKTLNRL